MRWNHTDLNALADGVSPAITATRRVVPVAIVDCLYWGVQGNSVNKIRINTYADFFLTESTPTSGVTNGNIYTEFVTMHRSDEAEWRTS